MTQPPTQNPIKYNTIHIDFPVCFKCEKPFGTGELRKTSHHTIPKAVNPKRNITIPLHEKCHNELNNLYASQRKKIKGPRPLKVFMNRMEGLVESYKKFGKKIEKVYDDFMVEVERIEDTKGNSAKLGDSKSNGG